MAFSFLDLIFPKRCVSCGSFGSYICHRCEKKIAIVEKPICAVCQRQAIGGKTHPGCRTKYGLDGLVVVFRYRGPVKAGIVKIKYRWIWDIAELVVSLFSRNVWKFSMPDVCTLVPIPLHTRRKRWRGFNQAELICQILSKKFDVPYSFLLERKIETKSQVGLTRQERKDNIRDAFRLRQNYKVVGQKFVLVDDVFTTGATISEACKVLKRAGAGEVWGMAIALG